MIIKGFGWISRTGMITNDRRRRKNRAHAQEHPEILHRQKNRVNIHLLIYVFGPLLVSHRAHRDGARDSVSSRFWARFDYYRD